MQSDDLFIRKFRRQNVRPPLATVNFDPKREAGVVEWPPRRPGDGADADCSLTPSRVGLTLRSVGRGHIMQRSNSDVTLGDLDSSGKTSGKVIRAAGEKAGTGPQGDSGVHLHREYGSLSSLERQTQGQDPSRENHGPLSPNALRFKDPFLLLGLEGNLPEPDGFFRDLSRSGGDSPKPAKPPKPEGLSKKSKLMPPQIPQPGTYDHLGGGAWVRNFAHYDVQSILFDLTEVATNRDSIGRKKNITSGASAASQLRPLAQSTPASPAQGGGGSGGNADDQEQSLLLDEGDGNDNELLLSCPHFRNETGGEEQVGLGRSAGRRELWSTLRTPNDAVSVLEEPRESNIQLQGKSNYFIEHADLGAHYYRKYFNLKEHQNFFGIDDRLGPVAISFRRDEKEGSSGAQYNYRIIFRTTEMKTLRGSILEESVPSAARHTTPRGLSPKRLLEFIMPELNLHCLRLASNSPKVRDTLLKLDEQGLNFQRKVGVMYCRAGQSSEEDMYNNESSGPAFEEFLDLLGERVRLKGWEKYRAQLDNKTDSTGTHSLYTRYQDYEIMFHVSTMLPYTANNTQQLLRKRHIGNDIVTIVFQEPGALPFTPKSIRSHFQHVFIIVQVHEPGTDHAYYRVAVTRSKDIPLFGPLFPRGARFHRSPAFRDFLLAKVVNAENAAEKSEKFRSMATRTRQEYLKDLAENYVTTTPIDSSTKFPLLSLGSKRKDKMKGAKGAELHSAGALVWAVMVSCRDDSEAGEQQKFPCLLGVSAESVVLIERGSRRVVFNCSCRDVIGWKAVTETKDGGPCLDIFYERGESVLISMLESQTEDIKEVVQRLELVTRGCEALEVTPLRDGVGQPGFLMNEEGFVTELQRFCYAESGGLQLWARVVRLCGHSLVHLSPEERSRLLRTAHKIHITVIPPDENGKPRRSFSELYQKAIKDAECKSGEDQSGVAWVVDEREDEREEQEQKVEEEQLKADRVEEEDEEFTEDELKMDGGGEQNEESPGPLLAPPTLPLLRATSLQDQPANQSEEISISQLTRSVSLEKQLSYTDTCDGHVYDNVMMKEKRHIYENVGELRDATPDLILAVKPKVPPEEEQFMAIDFGEDKASASDSSVLSSRLSSVDRAERNSRALSLHNSITKILSETTDSTDEEWQSIADLATACRSILEALSKEDRKAGDSSQGGADQTDGKLRDSKDSDSPGHLEEKVSQLEAMLKKLQDDLQKWAHKEKEDKAVLQAEVQSLRQNNQRLQEESQSTVARLIKVTELLCNVNKPC
ncbi:signal-induced proliferation-associated 1-like protein 2 isoform X1 [Xiphophorus hellerii]|uniref:signal-induced proliferation-associated 1-like protein 2 isoform X1 n=1 Tax=Xiphophorus hellerii TaxID=8084 RepID=UPI0013B3ED16|nr:signal-induced proliferation-associated 1-like protein 2 isoform X1 [Xiphophorus hellerii]XP_032431522.1 signal-induced proliferation-associated 1-like protein 2 isoform X1 [Xiphophorus hellerii]XP_032431523.1 signal-induced proliferation-associated 1-like protein 2 isoform X1 [Xiphophorus hellerii]XP_032431524.1 signal-induced proliferation-associated 1-like protein 2 isoform X1 [Xiphophorus hellerii]XP_032431525.1 signal-induced proliferation-associated 1-like protein 2 isoform X1 [Xiphoph